MQVNDDHILYQVEAVAAHTQAAVVSHAGLESPFLCHLREPPSTR